jgi:hypothetical protein
VAASIKLQLTIQERKETMFRCASCGRKSDVGETPQLVVIERRAKNYPFRAHANRVSKDGHITHSDDPGGQGWEIVKEVLMHKECTKEVPQ